MPEIPKRINSDVYSSESESIIDLPVYLVPSDEIRERLSAILPEELWAETSKLPYWGSHFMRTLLRCATQPTKVEDCGANIQINIVPVYIQVLFDDIYDPTYITPENAKKLYINISETVKRVICDKVPKTLADSNDQITMLQAFGASI